MSFRKTITIIAPVPLGRPGVYGVDTGVWDRVNLGWIARNEA